MAFKKPITQPHLEGFAAVQKFRELRCRPVGTVSVSQQGTESVCSRGLARNGGKAGDAICIGMPLQAIRIQ